MHSHFDLIITGSECSQTSLSNRWDQIQKAVNKFCGFFAQIELRNESGKTFEDKVRDTMVLYQQETRSAFTMIPLWTILRESKTWQSTVIVRHQKRKAEGMEGGDGERGDGEQDAQNSRPPGRKMAKMMAKDAHISSFILEVVQEMAESGREMAKQMKKKTAALELMSQDLIMSRNFADMDEISRQFYVFQKAQILKKVMEQNE